MMVADLETLLIRCAEAVAASDRSRAGDLLERIKRHSLPTGDATQRLAHYFAEGLEARLARSEEHTSELQSLRRISYAVFCLEDNFFNDTATTEIYTG